MTDVFNPVVDNVDLSIVPTSVPGIVPDVAVACRWQDAHYARTRHPYAAVIGPLRTLRGLDSLVRNLLANPQIRRLQVVGPDLTPGEATSKALQRLWTGDLEGLPLGPDLTPDLVHAVTDGVALQWEALSGPPQGLPPRDGPVLRLLPPPPTPEANAPLGDPGGRIVGAQMFNAWVRALREISRFGATVPTQYGPCREVLNLVTVIRDPKASLVGQPTWLPCTPDDVRAYASRYEDLIAPEGAPYSYGSRMRNPVDQIAAIERAVVGNPSSRALFASPWHPEDAEKVSGHPCLVGVQARLLDGALHLTMVFRSHDYWGAWPLNLGGACHWLCRMAERATLPAGTLTCLSVSAHLYERDLAAVAKILDKHPPAGLDLDPRSTWRVETVGERLRATAFTPDGAQVIDVFEGPTAAILQSTIEKSGLVTSLGNAMWIGRELGRAERAQARKTPTEA